MEKKEKTVTTKAEVISWLRRSLDAAKSDRVGLSRLIQVQGNRQLPSKPPLN